MKKTKEIKVHPRDLETFIICMFRYCLGSSTYMPDYFLDLLTQYIDVVSKPIKKQFLRDIEYYNKRFEKIPNAKIWGKVKELLQKSIV